MSEDVSKGANQLLPRVIPAYVLVGFLGSGKTTLLGRLIGWCLENKFRPGLILNEIGAAWIDGEAVRQEGLELTEIGEGCLCCTAEDDLIPALTLMAANPKVDIILLEASGLTDPSDMLDALTDPTLWQTVEVGGIISVVDAVRFEELCQDTPLARRQVRFGDVLVLNKCDLISRDQRQNLKLQLNELAPKAQLFPAENGLPFAGIEAVLSSSLEKGRKRFLKQQDIRLNTLKRPGFTLTTPLTLHSPAGSDDEHGHESMSIHVASFEFDRPVDGVLFENFLKSLPRSIYRAKGFLRLKGNDTLHTFQHIYGYT